MAYQKLSIPVILFSPVGLTLRVFLLYCWHGTLSPLSRGESPMPRTPSGNPPRKAVAVKLPPALEAQVRRYADLYHTSVSRLLCEGLALRLGHPAEPPGAAPAPALPPALVAMLRHLAETLSTAVDTLRALCAVCPPSTGTEYNGYTAADENGYNGNTSTSEQYNRHTLPETGDVPSLVDHTAPAVTPQPVAPEAPLVPVSTLSEKAAILAQLDAWKAEGLSLQAMADRLDAAGVPTFRGKVGWSKGTIGNLLAKRQVSPA